MQDPGRLIPPEDLAPRLPAESTVAERIAAWIDLVDATDEIYLATLRARGLSEAEVKEAYRENYARWAEEHDRRNHRILTVLDRARAANGR